MWGKIHHRGIGGMILIMADSGPSRRTDSGEQVDGANETDTTCNVVPLSDWSTFTLIYITPFSIYASNIY